MEVVLVVDSMDSRGEKKIEKICEKEEQGQRTCTLVVLEKVVKIEDKKKMEKTGDGADKENLPVGKQKSKEEPLQLNSQLVALINTAKLGDVRTLQKMTTAVKNFLAESYLKIQKRRQSVLLLLDREDFVPPLLMKCLKTNVSKMPQLVTDGLWILNTILGTGDLKIHKKIDALVDFGLIQLMTKLVGAQDNGVHDLATGALENLICWGYRDQLSAHAIPIFSAMGTLLKKKNRSTNIQKMCVHIISAILGQVRSTGTSKSSAKEVASTKCSRKDSEKKDVSWRCKELVDNLPPISLVKETIPLLNILVNSKDDEVLGKTLSCLAYAGCVEGSFQYIIDCGIMKKVAANITHSDEVVRFFAITSISSIASINETVVITFLKSLKGTFGLKHFYQGLTSDNDALLWAADQFFSTAVNAVTMERPVSDLNNIITSGMIHTFVQCLKPGMHEKHVMGGAWALGRISTEVPLSQRRYIVDAGALPLLVDQLKNENEIISSMAAVAIGNLIQEKPLNRDQIVSLGAIPLLIKLINRDDASIQAMISVLAALELIADVKPCASSEVMKDLPEALIAVLDNKSIKFPDKLVPGIYSIIGKLCDSGSTGIDIVLECGFLSRLTSALNSGNVDTLAFALEAFECISRGTKEQTDKLMEEVGIVEMLLELLQHPIRYIRKVAICTLSNLYKGQLTPERKIIIQKMVPEVLREMSKQDPRENHPAGLAFQNVLSNFHLQ